MHDDAREIFLPPESCESEIVVDTSIHIFWRIYPIQQGIYPEEPPYNEKLQVHEVQSPIAHHANLHGGKILALPKTKLRELHWTWNSRWINTSLKEWW